MLEFELSNKVKIPAMGIGTFLLSPDQAENSVKAALSCGYRLIATRRTPTSTSAPSAAR